MLRYILFVSGTPPFVMPRMDTPQGALDWAAGRLGLDPAGWEPIEPVGLEAESYVPGLLDWGEPAGLLLMFHGDAAVIAGPTTVLEA